MTAKQRAEALDGGFVKVYANGVVLRKRNRRLALYKSKGGNFILDTIRKQNDGEDLNKPCVYEETIKNRFKMVSIMFSPEALENLITMWVKMKYGDNTKATEAISITWEYGGNQMAFTYNKEKEKK